MPEYTKLQITGQVQGVFFRVSTREQAQRLGIVGYVRNMRDGSVEIVSSGKRLDEFIKWCHDGPQFSIVKYVKIKKITSDEVFVDFKITD